MKLAALALLALTLLLFAMRRRTTAEEPEPPLLPVDPWLAALADPEFVAGMRRAEADFKAGRVVPWAEVKRKYSL